jgi:hypothetical protein
MGRPVPSDIWWSNQYKHSQIRADTTMESVSPCISAGGGQPTEIPLFLLGALFVVHIRQPLERAVEPKIEGHSHRVSARQPPVRAPRGEEEHAHDSLLAHDRPEERRPCNTLRLLERLVERCRERAGARADLGCDGEDRIERPGRALGERFVSVRRRIEERDEEVAAREEAIYTLVEPRETVGRYVHMKEFTSFAFGDEALSSVQHLHIMYKIEEAQTFSTTCGNAFRGIGSAFFRLRTL